MTWLLEKRKILTPVVLRRIKMAMLGTAALAIGVLLVNTLLHLKTEPRVVEIPPSAPPPPPPPSPEVVVPVTDPFSLQIAAYLKEADARKFVEKLKNRGLDAYWIWTTSGGKTWYQVRLSHFKTKAEARAYGEALKGKQIINDYYITNYRAPESL